MGFILPDTGHNYIKNKNISENSTVRIAASFDMGWFTRATGRIHDTLSGAAALIGYFTRKVIAYDTLNRKCAKCNLGHTKDDSSSICAVR